LGRKLPGTIVEQRRATVRQKTWGVVLEVRGEQARPDLVAKGEGRKGDKKRKKGLSRKTNSHLKLAREVKGPRLDGEGKESKAGNTKCGSTDDLNRAKGQTLKWLLYFESWHGKRGGGIRGEREAKKKGGEERENKFGPKLGTLGRWSGTL